MCKIIYVSPSDFLEFVSIDDILATDVSDFEAVREVWEREVEFLFSNEEYKIYLDNKKKEILERSLH